MGRITLGPNLVFSNLFLPPFLSLFHTHTHTLRLLKMRYNAVLEGIRPAIVTECICLCVKFEPFRSRSEGDLASRRLLTGSFPLSLGKGYRPRHWPLVAEEYRRAGTPRFLYEVII